MTLKARYNNSRFFTIVLGAVLGLLLESRAFCVEESRVRYALVKIPSGNYTLQIPIDKSYEVIYLEKQITIKRPFLIGKFEVTNEDWQRCYQSGGCNRPAIVKPGEGPTNPVARVNWHDAKQYADWLSKITGHRYRLPTEEEWVFAAYQGRNRKEQEVTYNYMAVDRRTRPEKITLPKGHYGANDWGVYDTAGNVWEWTLSCWYSSETNLMTERSADELNTVKACAIRIAVGETRSHLSDFISDTYGGGCATLRPAANLGFRLVREN